ncbi:hypothetical protein KP509_15G036000 [Ceratopteris richardii]|nr:hypothetical protein KP509_15G036000 [Ceratopteris richardii]
MGSGRLKGGSSIPSVSNEGKSDNEELHVGRQTSAPKITEEGLLPQWGRGKRSRCSRPEASSKHAPSPSPVRECAPLPPLKKSVSNGIPSPKLRSQGNTKLPSSKCNASARPASRNGYVNKSVIASAQTTGNESARQILEAKDRTVPQQKRSADHSNGRQQLQRSECSDVAVINTGNGVGFDNASTMHQFNGTGAACETFECNKPKAEWPRIVLTLTRKEKEEDFLVFKGSKLPQRPKKRLKVVEKALLFCTPGNWLSDISRGRYDVLEKKCTKKKPRGLKAMDSEESDSE